YRRCLPKSLQDVEDEFKEALNSAMLENALNDVGSGAAVINSLSAAKELGQKIVQDLDDSWPFVVGGLGLAMVLCFLYIVLMRWFAGLMVWLSLFGVIALLIYCCYASYVKYDELKTAEADSINTDFIKDEVNEILAMKDTWLVFLIISAVLLAIVILLVIFLRNRIRIAIALIKEASKAVASITSTLVFPLFPWLLQILLIGWFVVVLLYLAGSSLPVYIAKIGKENCVCNNIKDGDRCDANNFAVCTDLCGDNSTCQISYYEKPKYTDYLHAYNIFGIFWGLFFISGLGDMILAGTFATWYWTFKKKDVPFFTLTRSIGRTFRYNLGTVAFGSLILAICRMIRVILEYISHKLKKYDNAFVKAILCCLKCFFWCLEKFIKFINKNAYIMCAVHGKNFCRSAKDAFNLLMRNVIRVFVLDKVTDFLLFLGKLLITAAMCALSFFAFTKEIDYYSDEIPTLNYTIIPVLFIGFGTYFIASIFFWSLFHGRRYTFPVFLGGL
ncbi:hypothetical protein L9F63_006675, partial [Diploptera punctata]